MSLTTDDPRDDLVEIDRTRSAHDARERALVLDAAGLPYVTDREGSDHVLAVPAAVADQARDELRWFAAENVGWPPPRLDLTPPTRGLWAAGAYAVIIGYFYHLQRLPAFGLDWWNCGMARADRIIAGEWWRTVTPLTLHSDPVHLAGNMAFGAIFVAAAAQAVGDGVALLGIVLAGGLGNLLNALIQPPDHSSVGASTASFAAVGLLVAHLWRRRRTGNFSRLQRWTPPFIGVVLLGYLGTSGERTDVMAHITGFASGTFLGLLAALTPAAKLRKTATQLGAASLAAALLGMCWYVAFQACSTP